MYFRADESLDFALVRAFLSRLHSIESWFTVESSYRFIASSLLFVYDGERVRQQPPRRADSVAKPADGGSADIGTLDDVLSDAAVEDGDSDTWWEGHFDLKMIDFTHAFPATSPDENYLTGLRSLIGYVSRLKPGMYLPDS